MTIRDEGERGGWVMNWRSVWAIVAGILVVMVVTTAVDVVLHLTAVFPPMNQPLSDACHSSPLPIESSSGSEPPG